MSIPESQLKFWSNLGAQQASANTYNSIKTALKEYSWPTAMDHKVYLQGSYPNFTNIRGDSDVDIVVETTNVFYHNVPNERRTLYGLTNKGSYGWQEFRAEVKTALLAYYGHNQVVESRSGKCIKVMGKDSRLNADVVPCVTYRKYTNYSHFVSGMTFWTKHHVQIVNYPKIHLKNGSEKNSQCGENYKPTVRIFKNARNEVNSDFPSYFLECMLYNVPNNCYPGSYSDLFYKVLKFFHGAKTDGTLQNFQCQNEQQYMFGNELHQVNLSSARDLIDELIELWNH